MGVTVYAISKKETVMMIMSIGSDFVSELRPQVIYEHMTMENLGGIVLTWETS
jgi:hypothetical protein